MSRDLDPGLRRGDERKQTSDALHEEIESKGGGGVFVLDQNFLLWVCVAVVGGVVGFVVYGCIKGFDHLFPND